MESGNNSNLQVPHVTLLRSQEVVHNKHETNIIPKNKGSFLIIIKSF